MAELLSFTPNEDDLTRAINKTIPSKIENLSPKLKKNFLFASVGGIKGILCGKVGSALNLVTGLKSGSLNFAPNLKDFNLNSFFAGPLDGITNKMDFVVRDFNNISQSFKNNELNLKNNNLQELLKIETQNIERFESTQLTSNSFGNSINSIQNLSNKTIRDIENNPLQKKSLKDKLCESAELELINNALVAKSIITVAKEQEKLIKQSNNLVDRNKLVEQTSKLESLLP